MHTNTLEPAKADLVINYRDRPEPGCYDRAPGRNRIPLCAVQHSI